MKMKRKSPRKNAVGTERECEDGTAQTVLLQVFSLPEEKRI